MGTSVLGNLDSQVWKMLGLDAEDIKDKNKIENNETDKKGIKNNERNTEEERLRRD